MTFNEAAILLAKAPRSDKPSRLNANISENQAVIIVGEYIGSEIDKGKGDQQLDYIMEKRVHQVTKNQVRPRF